MARTFVAASSQYLTFAGVPVSAVPLSISAWVKPTDFAAAYGVAGMGNTATGSVAMVHLDPTTGKVCARLGDGAVTGTALSTTGLTVAAWGHMCGVFPTLSSRSAFANGGAKATDTTVLSAPVLNTTEIGDLFVGGRVWLLNGSVAEVGIWNIALDDMEVAALAAGVSPLLVRPASLVAYWPLIGHTSPEIDLVGRRELTVVGATPSPHLRVFYPTSLRLLSGRIYVLAGVTKNSSGAALAGCTVRLFRTSDNLLIASTTSDGSGNYSFTVVSGVNYYVVAYLAGSPDVAGTTLNTLVGV